MNLADKKILECLDSDSRQPFSAIAKKVRLSKQSVITRINKLESRGIINSYVTITNYFNLGYCNVNLFIKTEGISDNKLKEIIQKLNVSKSITWVARLFGEYDLAISIFFKTVVELSKTTNYVFSLLGSSIQKKKLYLIDLTKVFSVNFDGKGRHAFTANLENSHVHKIDEKDAKILLLIESRSRIPLLSIAKDLDISLNSVKYRIKRLKSNGIILGHKLFVNYNKLGYQWNLCIMNTFPGSNTGKLIKELSNDPHIIFINKTICGTILFDILSENFIELKKELDSIKEKNEEIVRYKIMNIIGIEKLVSYTL